MVGNKYEFIPIRRRQIMPFCTQCGKKLEDGEVCSCQTEIKEAAGQEEENPVHDEEQALQTEERCV